jgi:uncharacterized protein involved in tellurium resistance
MALVARQTVSEFLESMIEEIFNEENIKLDKNDASRTVSIIVSTINMYNGSRDVAFRITPNTNAIDMDDKNFYELMDCFKSVVNNFITEITDLRAHKLRLSAKAYIDATTIKNSYIIIGNRNEIPETKE